MAIIKRWSGIALGSALLALLALGFSLGDQGASAQAPGPPGRFLVFTNGDPAVNAAVENRAQQRGGRIVDAIRVAPGLSLVVAEVPGAVVAELAGIPGVREVSPEVVPQPVDDPIPWGVDRIEAECVWGDTGNCQSGIGSARSVHVKAGSVAGAGVVVAVTDTGVQLDHVDLIGNTSGQPHADCSGDGECTIGGALTPGSPGYDNANDDHGSHVAGIAAATHNGAQVIGVAPQAKILSANCFDPGTFFSCLRAVLYSAGRTQAACADGTAFCKTQPNRAHVVNMSWGWSKNLENQCPSCVETINTVMETAWGDGLLLVAAAGNSGKCGGTGDNVIIPARLDKPIAVAATTQSDGSPCWSSTGPSLDLAAPGVGILSTVTCATKDCTASFSGTSMAAPHVSGVGALVWSANSGWTNAQVRSRLLSTAQDLTGGAATGQNCGGGQTHDRWFGCGLVKANGAVTSGIASTNTVPTADNKSVTTNEDTTVNVILSGSDPETCELNFLIVSGPSKGSLSAIGSQTCVTGSPNTDSASVTYTPSANFNGSDSFTYKVNDGTADSNIATVTITVNAVNDAPVAANKSATTTAGTPVTITLTATDVDNCELAFSIVTGLSNASGSLSGITNAACTAGSPNSDSATITYTPNAGFTGTDSFTYKVNDGIADSNTATVSITVSATSTNTVHVGDLDGQSVKLQQGYWKALVTIYGHKADHTPATGFTVTGTFAQNGWTLGITCTDGGTGDGDGVADGKCVVDSGQFPSKSGSASFTVTDLILTGYTYDATANHDPDGDSNGTTIQLSK